MEKPILPTAADAGCWIDGHWGQYGVAREISIAASYGFVDTSPEDAGDLVDIARRHLSSMGPSNSPDITPDEYWLLNECEDFITQWLTDRVAPEGYSFGWHDGEFFLQSEEWWNESYDE